MSKTGKGFSKNVTIIGIAALVIGLIVVLFIALSSSNKGSSTATVSTANLNTNQEQTELTASPLTTTAPENENSAPLQPPADSSMTASMPNWSIDSSDLPESISANQNSSQSSNFSAAPPEQKPPQPPAAPQGPPANGQPGPGGSQPPPRNDNSRPGNGQYQRGVNPQAQNSPPGQQINTSPQQLSQGKLAINSQPVAPTNRIGTSRNGQFQQGGTPPPGAAGRRGGNALGSGSTGKGSSTSNDNSSGSGTSGNGSSWGQSKHINNNNNGKSKPGAVGSPPDGGAWGSGNGGSNPGAGGPRNRNGNFRRGDGQLQQGENPGQQNSNQDINVQQPSADSQLALTDQPPGSDFQQNNQPPDQTAGNFPPGGRGGGNGQFPPGGQSQPVSGSSQPGNDNSQLSDGLSSLLGNDQSTSNDSSVSNDNSGGLGNLLSDNQISDLLKQLASPDQNSSTDQGSSTNSTNLTDLLSSLTSTNQSPSTESAPQGPIDNLTRMLHLKNIIGGLMNLITLMLPKTGTPNNNTTNNDTAATLPTLDNSVGNPTDTYCPENSYVESSGAVNACLTPQLDVNCTKSGGTWQSLSGSIDSAPADSNLNCASDTPVFYQMTNASNVPDPTGYYCRCNTDQCVEADTATCIQSSQTGVQDPSETNCEASGGTWQNMDCGISQEFCGSESVGTNCQGVYQHRCICPAGTCLSGPAGFCTNSPGVTDDQRKSNCGITGGTWKQFVDQCVANQQKCLYREIGQNICSDDQYQNAVWGCDCPQDQCLTESGRCASVYN